MCVCVCKDLYCKSKFILYGSYKRFCQILLGDRNPSSVEFLIKTKAGQTSFFRLLFFDSMFCHFNCFEKAVASD